MGTKAKWLKGKLTFHNNAVVEENVTSVVAGTTIRNYGLVVLSPTTDQSYYINGGPAIGQKLEIVVDTSLIASVFTSTTNNQVRILGAATDINGMVFIPGSTYSGGSVTLRGVTTDTWAITSFSTGKGGLALTTAIS
jgi:hypothetical protein